MRLGGLCQRKIPMTPSGIEPATFRFVAQHLNHCATAVPLIILLLYIKINQDVLYQKCGQTDLMDSDHSVVVKRQNFISCWCLKMIVVSNNVLNEKRRPS